MTTDIDISGLIKKHAPVMIMYPEIPSGTVREQEWNHEFRENMKSPLPYDYHPRDVRLVLEYSIFHEWFRWFRRRRKITTSQGMLDRMQRVKYRKNLDVFPKVKREDRDTFWERYAAIPKDSNPDYTRVCYARAVHDANSNRLLIQYWYAYLYNDFWNYHEMDWEAVMVVLSLENGVAEPITCASSAHHIGYKLPWADVEKANDNLEKSDAGTHPVIYVAHGSHANYFYGPGRYFTAPEIVSRAARYLQKDGRELIDFVEAWNSNTAFLVEAEEIPNDSNGQWSGDWRWLNQQGRWGSAGDWDLEFGDAGPYGPQRNEAKWGTPFAWIENDCVPAERPQ